MPKPRINHKSLAKAHTKLSSGSTGIHPHSFIAGSFPLLSLNPEPVNVPIDGETNPEPVVETNPEPVNVPTDGETNPEPVNVPTDGETNPEPVNVPTDGETNPEPVVETNQE